MIPIRCWSCGTVVAHLYKKYNERTIAGENPEEVLDDLKLQRYCCRRMFVGHIDLIDDIAPFSLPRDN